MIAADTAAAASGGSRGGGQSGHSPQSGHGPIQSDSLARNFEFDIIL